MSCFSRIKYSKIFATILSFIIIGFSFSQSPIIIDSQSNMTSWQVPAGVDKIKIECIGGGGGGGFVNLTGDTGAGTGGGGGGAYASSVICVEQGETFTFSVGTGGSGLTGTHDGTDTWFGISAADVIVKAAGGKGVADNTANGANGGSASSSIGSVVYSGGNGGSGIVRGHSGDCFPQPYNDIAIGGGGGAAGNGNTSTINGADADADCVFSFLSQNTTYGGDPASGGVGDGVYSGDGGIGAIACSKPDQVTDADGGIGGEYGGGGGGGVRAGSTGSNRPMRPGGDGGDGVIVITFVEGDVEISHDDEICMGVPVELTATLLPGTDESGAFSWQPGGGTSSTITVSLTGDTEYIVFYSYGPDCYFSDTVNVIVENCFDCDLPAPSTVNFNVCAPETVDLLDAFNNWPPDVDKTFHNSQADAENNTNSINNVVSSSGTYWLRLQHTDEINCWEIHPITVTIGDINITVNKSDISCGGANDGSIQLSTDGGTPNYNYTWNPAVSTSNSASNLESGTYEISVVDASGCSDVVQVNIVEPDSLDIQVTVTETTCGLDDGSILIDVSGGAGGFTYSWTPDVSTSHIATGLGEGQYHVVVTDQNGCSESIVETVNVGGSIPINASPNMAEIEYGDSVEINVTTPSNLEVEDIFWMPADDLSCSDCANPTATPETTTTYYVIVTDVNGCISKDSVHIIVLPPCSEVFVPNSFSPNGDGVNDFQCVFGSCIVGMDFIIFNTWGEAIFQSEDKTVCWDGTFRGEFVQSGIYFYTLKANLRDGRQIKQAGEITVVR